MSPTQASRSAGEGVEERPRPPVPRAALDDAIEAVRRRRRHRGRARPGSGPQANGAEGDLDRRVFDPQTLSDLVDFLRDARNGLLTDGEIVQEAGVWQRLLAAGWPTDAHDAVTIWQAVDLLASTPVLASATAQRPPTHVEPANDLERALAAAAHDEDARPQLWQALYDGEIVLPVVAYELVRPEGANFQFLSAPMGSTPLVLGFATEERFDALLPPGSQVSRVRPLGRQLPRLWPEGHWLVINPGYDNQVVLSPWEIAGLPHGSRAELPLPRSVHLRPPDGDDERLAVLADAVAALPGVEHIAWARVRARKAPDHVPWRDVLVVAATPAAGGNLVPATGQPDEAGERDGKVAGPERADGHAPTAAERAEADAVRLVSARLRSGPFPRALVIGRQADLRHPFIEAAVAASRTVTASPSRDGAPIR